VNAGEKERGVPGAGGQALIAKNLSPARSQFSDRFQAAQEIGLFYPQISVVKKVGR
jgi:hypothetical protein